MCHFNGTNDVFSHFMLKKLVMTNDLHRNKDNVIFTKLHSQQLCHIKIKQHNHKKSVEASDMVVIISYIL